MGTSIDFCLQTVCYQGRSGLFLETIFRANFRENKMETWAKTSYLLFFSLHIKMQLFLSLTFSWVCCLFLTKRCHVPARFLLTPEVVKGECEIHFGLLCSINAKQFLHFWRNLPLVEKKPSECAREHLKCYLTVVKIWPSSMFQLNYQENAIHYEDLNHLTSLVWLLMVWGFFITALFRPFLFERTKGIFSVGSWMEGSLSLHRTQDTFY